MKVVKPNKKIGEICKVCGFGSIAKELSEPLTKFDLKMHMPSHMENKNA